MEEREREREALRRGKSDLEEQKRLLDRALEKISKEVNVFFAPLKSASIYYGYILNFLMYTSNTVQNLVLVRYF